MVYVNVDINGYFLYNKVTVYFESAQLRIHINYERNCNYEQLEA